MAPTEVREKSDKFPSVSVVIPTLGRESLFNSILSAIDQTVKPLEVLVICHDSLCDTQVISQAASIPLVKILRNSHGTASENRNQGIRESLGDFVAFLDDDDIWLPLKLESQLQLVELQNYDLVACKARYQGWRNEEVPKEIYSNKLTFLKSLYGKWDFGARKYGIPTPTILVRAAIAREFQFDTNLQEREDLLFVDKVERAGYRISQIDDVLVEVASSKPFSHRQTVISQDLYWFKYLSDRQSILNWKFLITVALRNRLMTFQVFTGIKLLFGALKVSVKK
jgi:glycosyltransferase involved in cell wall biosynthesis